MILIRKCNEKFVKLYFLPASNQFLQSVLIIPTHHWAHHLSPVWYSSYYLLHETYNCDANAESKSGKGFYLLNILNLPNLIHDPFIPTIYSFTPKSHSSLFNPKYTTIPYIHTHDFKIW